MSTTGLAYTTIDIGIGSNLEQPQQQVQHAIATLRKMPESNWITASSLYRSAPMGPQDQPDFINAVAMLSTQLAPEAVLDFLQDIEQLQGRVRTAQRWGPRTLDLDLLLYGEKIIRTDRLTVPHPGLHERAFVLYPLQEINPQLEIPDLGPLAKLTEACPVAGLERIESNEG